VRELIIGAPGDLELKGSVFITQVKNGSVDLSLYNNAL
jgi:hypothetical protein